MRHTYASEVYKACRERTNNVRNMTVSGHVDHGKTTLVDCLLARAGIIKEDSSGTCVMDCGKQEKERGITMKSTGISLLFQRGQQQSKEYLINLVDSPGHIHFSCEVSAALRISDGTLLVVDSVEGVCVQTETVTRQALKEKVKPVLHLNKLDKAIDLQLEPEQLYQRLNNTVDSVNQVILSYYENIGEPVDQSCLLDPVQGNVSFGSGKQGWAFTLPQFASIYSSMCNMPSEKLLPRLWGDWYYDPTTKKFSRISVSKTGKKLERAFSYFVMRPIRTLFSSDSTSGGQIDLFLSKIGLSLSPSERQLEGRELVLHIMRKWLPASDALLDLIIDHVPSPIEAQPKRLPALYSGPQDDVYAQAISQCDPDGPLLLFVSKLVPMMNSKHLCAFGRVFSGTVRAHQTVYVINDNASLASPATNRSSKVNGLNLMMGKFTLNIDEMCCGGIVSLLGMDNVISKCGTISSVPHAFPITPMTYAVSPIVQRSIKSCNPMHRGKIANALHCLSQCDQCMLVRHCEEGTGAGDFVVAGAGELHLEVILTDLQEMVGSSCVFTVGPPAIDFCESVRERSPMVYKAKTSNKLNRLYFSAEPLDESLVTYFENLENNEKLVEDSRLTSHLTNKLGWSSHEAKKVLKIKGTNFLVDATHSVDHLGEVLDGIISAFEEIVENSALCGEPLRGTRFNLVDAQLHSDKKHRSSQLIKNASCRAMKTAVLSASPCLFEPIYTCEIALACTSGKSGSGNDDLSVVKNLLKRRRGEITRIDDLGCSLLVQGYLPIAESFGFEGCLRKETSGRGFPNMKFDHWRIMDDDISKRFILDVRARKRIQFQDVASLGCAAEYPNIVSAPLFTARSADENIVTEMVQTLGSTCTITSEPEMTDSEINIPIANETVQIETIETEEKINEIEKVASETLTQEQPPKSQRRSTVRCGICKMRGHTTAQHNKGG